MPGFLTVQIPLLNPNEPDALLAAVHVSEGQAVQKGDLLCTLETTKSTAEVEAEASGYLRGLRLQAGQTVKAGEIFAFITPSPSGELPESGANQNAPGDGEALPHGLRITQPALALARRSQLDLNQLPTGPLVTESMVRTALEDSARAAGPSMALPLVPFDPMAIIVYGGGGHGKAVIDLLRRLGIYHIVGIIDDGLAVNTQVMGVQVLGGSELLPQLASQGVRLAANAVGGIGSVAVRVKIFHKLGEAGFSCPALVHPSAVIEPSAQLSAGVHIFPLAYVGSEARLEFGVIVNTRAIVSHECHIEAYANLSPGAILAGQVRVGAGALVGMGATVNLQVTIGRLARIGNGATVKSDVPENGIVRAGGIWPS